MNSARPFPALPENQRLWFSGAAVSAKLLAASAAAPADVAAGEWLRPYFDREAWDAGNADTDAAAWRRVIDFPPALDRTAAERAGTAWEVFRRAGGRLPRGDAAELRIALAKVERAFIAPARGGRLRWRELDALTLPGRGLLVLARDDEFVAGVSASRWCELWRRTHGGRAHLAALRSFPLPWPPATLRSALTREQEERRDAVIRAWRSRDEEEIDGHVGAAYGWRTMIEDEEAVARLHELHLTRSASLPSGAATPPSR